MYGNNPYRKSDGSAMPGRGRPGKGGRYGEGEVQRCRKKLRTMVVKYENFEGNSRCVRSIFRRWEISDISRYARYAIWEAVFGDFSVPQPFLDAETLARLPSPPENYFWCEYPD